MEKETEQKLDDIAEMLRFVKDHGATQESLDTLAQDLRSEMGTLAQDLQSEMGGLRREMHEGFNSVRAELREIRDEIEEIKHYLDVLEKRTREDVDAVVHENYELRKRVEKLERRVDQFEAAH